MALDATANLRAIVTVDSRGGEGSLRRLQGQLGGLGKNLGTVGGAFRTLGSRAAAVGSVLGVAGVGGAVLALGGFLGGALQKAQEFGRAVQDLSKLTGLDVQTTSKLVDVLDKYGITGDMQVRTIGMLEKNVGNLTQTTADAVKFQEDFGFALLDANGQVKDANELLYDAADFFNSSASASQKAALMAKLFGRSWQDLIPVLALGSKGLKRETADAIQLTDAQIEQMAQFRTVQRDFQDALGDIQTLVGVDFMPDITSGLRTAAAWLKTHQDDVRAFFRNGLDTAKALGSFISGTVVPAISSIAEAGKNVWSQIPGPLKDLLVKGFIADRTFKFLFGIDPAKAVLQVAGGLLSRGGTPFTPVYVKEVALGGRIGPTAPGPGGGGVSILTQVVGAVAGLGIAEAIAAGYNEVVKTVFPDFFKELHSLAPFGGGTDGIETLNDTIYDASRYQSEAMAKVGAEIYDASRYTSPTMTAIGERLARIRDIESRNVENTSISAARLGTIAAKPAASLSVTVTPKTYINGELVASAVYKTYYSSSTYAGRTTGVI